MVAGSNGEVAWGVTNSYGASSLEEAMAASNRAGLQPRTSRSPTGTAALAA